MRAIAVVARTIAEGNLAACAPVAGSRETADVAAQLNQLLDRMPRIESQLRESEKRLSLVLGAAHEGILVSDVAQRITFANDAAARLLGFGETSEVIGRRLPEVLPDPSPDDRPRRASEERLGRADRYERRLHAHDGVDRWLFVSETPFRGDSGGFEGALAMLYDVTERKEVEERLARAFRVFLPPA